MQKIVDTVVVDDGLKLILLDREKIQEIANNQQLDTNRKIHELLTYQFEQEGWRDLTGTDGAGHFDGFCCVDQWEPVDKDDIRIVGEVYYDEDRFSRDLVRELLAKGEVFLSKLDRSPQSPTLILEYDGLTNEEGELY